MSVLYFRLAGEAERDSVRVLSHAVRRRHLHDKDSPENPVLFLHPHHPLCPHIFHGPAGLHPAARLGREAHAR